MKCEKCGHEMMQQEMTAFYTHYVCFMCGHEVYFCPLDDDDTPGPDEDTPGDHVFNPDRPDLMTEDEYQDWLHRSGGD